MFSFRQYLEERWVTSDKPEVKSQYHDKAHAMLKASYKSVGGYGGLGHGSEEEHRAISQDINHPDHIIKLKKRAGEPHAVAIYKKANGRKLIAAGTNGTDEGKQHLYRMVKDDHRDKRAWAEVSHAMEHIFKKQGHPEIPNEKAHELTGKEILKHNPDNSYDREIGGEVHTKRMMGHPGNHWKSKS
jgi:hypothetical protein